MQSPAQVPHCKKTFLPLPAPQLSLCPAPGTPGKVFPVQSWDQYSCQALATLPLLIGITAGRLQLSLHLSVACHNGIKTSLSLFITECDRSRGSHKTTESSRCHWGWAESPSLPKLQLLDGEKWPEPPKAGRDGDVGRGCSPRCDEEGASLLFLAASPQPQVPSGCQRQK